MSNRKVVGDAVVEALVRYGVSQSAQPSVQDSTCAVRWSVRDVASWNVVTSAHALVSSPLSAFLGIAIAALLCLDLLSNPWSITTSEILVSEPELHGTAIREATEPAFTRVRRGGVSHTCHTFPVIIIISPPLQCSTCKREIRCYHGFPSPEELPPPFLSVPFRRLSGLKIFSTVSLRLCTFLTTFAGLAPSSSYLFASTHPQTSLWAAALAIVEATSIVWTHDMVSGRRRIRAFCSTSLSGSVRSRTQSTGSAWLGIVIIRAPMPRNSCGVTCKQTGRLVIVGRHRGRMHSSRHTSFMSSRASRHVYIEVLFFLKSDDITPIAQFSRINNFLGAPLTKFWHINALHY